ncbi:hypothetical protein CA267_009655 [Alteromonas pelagimontana]|uniref:Uncharacterized protein n=1 Tax=Alteromonas pelagimontana TaxID=1858656 RepID=A0A6M4MD19_9ALTE|nr:hypothetical protein [Alteromonas pelagimontana]QJR81023.1 hypothetical protein CA267_009655 [Alteromonas pelagimontana]
MKKSLVSLFIGATLAFSATAQDQAGGEDATSSTVGGVATSTIAAGVVAVGIAAAIVSNNRGSADIDAEGPNPGCEGTDPLVNGVCVGTTVTDTVTVSGTGTATITVPVTVTYAPSV